VITAVVDPVTGVLAPVTRTIAEIIDPVTGAITPAIDVLKPVVAPIIEALPLVLQPVIDQIIPGPTVDADGRTSSIPAHVYSAADSARLEAMAGGFSFNASTGPAGFNLDDQTGDAVGPLGSSRAAAALAGLGANVEERVSLTSPAPTTETAAEATTGALATTSASQNQRRGGFEMPDTKALLQLSLAFMALGGFALLVRSESRPRSWTYQLTNPPA
jgi:hypothetical protein